MEACGGSNYWARKFGVVQKQAAQGYIFQMANTA